MEPPPASLEAMVRSVPRSRDAPAPRWFWIGLLIALALLALLALGTR
jgi:hypothetical protein